VKCVPSLTPELLMKREESIPEMGCVLHYGELIVAGEDVDVNHYIRWIPFCSFLVFAVNKV